MVNSKVWGAGTVEALERRNGAAGVVSVQQINASMEVENERLRARLALAEQQIRELQAQLAAAEAPEAELVTFTQAARIMAVHVSTISRWVDAGHFSTRYVGGRKKPFILKSTLHRPKRKKKGDRRASS